MKEYKVQTGLRIPEKQYERLRERADKMGVSLNSLMLMLIELGLEVIDRKRDSVL